jgi:hypothetical protein
VGKALPGKDKEAAVRRLRKLGIALVLALLLTLLNMVASVLAGSGPSLPTVETQRDCPELNGETHYLYVDDDGLIVRCLGD